MLTRPVFDSLDYVGAGVLSFRGSCVEMPAL